MNAPNRSGVAFFGVEVSADMVPRGNHAIRVVKERSIPVSLLHELFELTEDGRLINRHFRNCKSPAGKEAGSLNTVTGYRTVCVNKRSLLTHRVVYAMTHGNWPGGILDHIDGNKQNNRPDNLRPTTFSKNAQNVSTARKNMSGTLGVRPTKNGTYTTAIVVGGAHHYLGTFSTPEEAGEVYLAAKKVAHPSAREVQDVQVDCFTTCLTVFAFKRFLKWFEALPKGKGE